MADLTYQRTGTGEYQVRVDGTLIGWVLSGFDRGRQRHSWTFQNLGLSWGPRRHSRNAAVLRGLELSGRCMRCGLAPDTVMQAGATVEPIHPALHPFLCVQWGAAA
jgi:hypothetical protein